MMADDARQLVVAGVDGIVIGCLDAYGDVDVAACKAIIAAAQEGCKERTEDAQYLVRLVRIFVPIKIIDLEGV